MQQKSFFTGRNRDMLLKFNSDSSPLRDEFIKLQDQRIYNTICNYFNSVKKLLWDKSPENSYIIKTVGIQAQFDILKLILKENVTIEPSSINFDDYIVKSTNIDFSDKFFQASGIGRSRIKNTLALNCGLIQFENIKKKDLPFYRQVIEGLGTSIENEKWYWEEEAERELLNTLEKAEWNYGNKSVSLYLQNDYENLTTLDNYTNFFDKLVEIAETTFNNSLPTDPDFAEGQRENFDSEDLVNSVLVNYEDNLKLLGWQS